MTSSPLRPSDSGAARPPSVGHRSSDGQLNFCSGSRLAPNIQSRAHLPCSLSNTRQTPVSGASAFLQHLRLHALSIVPHTQPKLVFAVHHISLDTIRLGVPES